MNHDTYDDALIDSVLRGVKSVAIVGASMKNIRPSYFVVKYLIDKGFLVFPINPGHAGSELLGRPVHASLTGLPEPVDMVDIFRNSDAADAIVDEAIALDNPPKVIWMQLGVRNDDAARKAEAAGMTVIMNRCPKIEYGRLSGEIGWMGVNSRVISGEEAGSTDHGLSEPRPEKLTRSCDP